MTAPDVEFDKAVGLLRGAFLLDHSVSVGKLGSVFERGGDAPVQQLKRLIADAYGVAWSFPASCGTSPLNVLALLSACRRGGRVLINRDCHVSMHAAMIQAELEPIYYLPAFDQERGILLGAVATDIEEALTAHGTVEAVVTTYPNYFGIAGDLREIVELARRRNIPVIADEAHGAHFHFSTAMPLSAEDAGADLICQSTHKTLGALSQGSVLLFRGEEFIDAFYHAVSHLGVVSTSFSYPTLSSIELAVVHNRTQGEEAWLRAVDEAERFRAEACDVIGISTFGVELAGRPGFRHLDRSRVTLDVSGTGLTGFEFRQALADDRIYAELATERHVLFLFTPATRTEDTNYLLSAVRRIAQRGPAVRRIFSTLGAPALPRPVMTPREAFFAAKRAVPVDGSIGEIAGETIAAYPPGWAIIVAGERIDGDALEYLRRVRHQGAALHGAADPDLERVTIIA